MNWLLVILVLPTGFIAGVLIVAIIRDRRELRRWQAERRRIAAYHERAAARNTRPHTDAVTRR